MRRTLQILETTGPLPADDVTGAVFQASVFQDVGRFEKSLEVLGRIGLDEPVPRTAHELRLNALRVLRRPAEARSLLDLLLWASPDDARWHYERGEVLAAMGESTLAREDFQRAQGLDRDWWMPYVAEAAVLLGEAGPGSAEEAEAVLERSPAPPGSQPTLGFHRALSAEARGDDGEARRRYEALLAQHPDHQPSRINLALLHERSGNPRHARRLFQQALDGTPEEQRIRRQSLEQRIQRLDESLAKEESPEGS